MIRYIPGLALLWIILGTLNVQFDHVITGKCVRTFPDAYVVYGVLYIISFLPYSYTGHLISWEVPDKWMMLIFHSLYMILYPASVSKDLWCRLHFTENMAWVYYM